MFETTGFYYSINLFADIAIDIEFVWMNVFFLYMYVCFDGFSRKASAEIG